MLQVEKPKKKKAIPKKKAVGSGHSMAVHEGMALMAAGCAREHAYYRGHGDRGVDERCS